MDEPIQEPRPRIGQVVGDAIAAQEAADQIAENTAIAEEPRVGANRQNGQSNWGRKLAARIALAGQQ